MVLSLLLSHQISMNALRGGLVAVKSVIIHQDHMYVAVEEVRLAADKRFCIGKVKCNDHNQERFRVEAIHCKS